MFSLKIETDNDAFAAWPDNGHTELARILRELAAHLEATDANAGQLRDMNGNTVGFWNARGNDLTTYTRV